MIDPRRSVRILAALILVLAACGGGGAAGAPSASTAATAPAGSTVAPDPGASTGGGSVAGGAESAETFAAPSAAEPAPGGGSIADVCALVTGDELTAIFGTAVTTEVFAGPPDTCQVGSTDGAGLAAFVLTNMKGVSASLVRLVCRFVDGERDRRDRGEGRVRPEPREPGRPQERRPPHGSVFDDGQARPTRRLVSTR
jgi:hypothetical protein